MQLSDFLDFLEILKCNIAVDLKIGNVLFTTAAFPCIDSNHSKNQLTNETRFLTIQTKHSLFLNTLPIFAEYPDGITF